jgi:orotate phosphoribosyltransferase
MSRTDETDGTDGTDGAAFLELVGSRRGHFRLESGHHSALWLDLDALFAAPRRIDPFIDALSGALRPYAVEAVCGPLLGGAFLAQLVARALDAKFYFTERVLPSDGGGMYPVRYRLPPTFADRVRRTRVAVVDDVMSAGSALLGTCLELQAHGALPVVAGALLVLGSTGADRCAERKLPVEAVARESFSLWRPEECPLCQEDLPLVDATTPPAAQNV